ncbi:hypothetical protein PVAG01_00261 [Phlyctema vagabunda]|uniref:Uncharacterized protein n=1 Tax=Phlyctema vagabunda TaxID=108571 RepID=A0ABR4PTQ8_9HELO
MTCPAWSNNGVCTLSAKGSLNPSWSYNISGVLASPEWNGPSGPETFLSNLVQQSTRDATFNSSIVGIIDTSAPLRPGRSAYLNFTMLRKCYVGTLSNCSGDGVTDGMGIEACAPLYHMLETQPTSIVLDGEVRLVNVFGERGGWVGGSLRDDEFWRDGLGVVEREPWEYRYSCYSIKYRLDGVIVDPPQDFFIICSLIRFGYDICRRLDRATTIDTRVNAIL